MEVRTGDQWYRWKTESVRVCLLLVYIYANIVTICKRKEDKAICGNRRGIGISLLSVAGKVLAGVMLRRLLTHVVDIVMPESQCGFRRGRSAIDMMFVAVYYRKQESQLMLTTGSTRLAVSRGQQTWYHSTCNI